MTERELYKLFCGKKLKKPLTNADNVEVAFNVVKNRNRTKSVELLVHTDKQDIRYILPPQEVKKLKDSLDNVLE